MSPTPKACELIAAGVVFVHEPGRASRVKGPQRACAVAATEVVRRAEAFVRLLRFQPAPARAVQLPGVTAPAPRRGRCLHCAEPLEAPMTDGGCDLCHAALARALRELERLPSETRAA